MERHDDEITHAKRKQKGLSAGHREGERRGVDVAEGEPEKETNPKSSFAQAAAAAKKQRIRTTHARTHARPPKARKQLSVRSPEESATGPLLEKESSGSLFIGYSFSRAVAYSPHYKAGGTR